VTIKYIELFCAQTGAYRIMSIDDFKTWLIQANYANKIVEVPKHGAVGRDGFDYIWEMVYVEV
jgi:hypothetical protein